MTDVLDIEDIEQGRAGIADVFDRSYWVLLSRDQSTGLTDKNGTEIFEGDIVHARIGGDRVVKFGEWYRPKTHKHDSDGHHYGWYLERTSGEKVCFLDCQFRPNHLCRREKKDWLTVIGNIYENPDLLK